MRPLPGSTAFPVTPSSNDGASDCLASASQSTAAHMSFILTDEATIDSSLAPQFLPLRTRDQRKHAIHTVPGDISAPNRELGAASPATASRSTPTLQPRDNAPPRSVPATNPSPARVHTPPPIASQPMTPILYGVSGPCSAISSASSRRNSLVGSLSEYQESFVMSAFGSSEPGQPQSSYVGEGAQQFIMPTINVPSRRPFTETGKSLGRLKLLMAGRSGLLPGNALPSDPPIGQGTFQITETFASTKPYPPWWKGSVQGTFMSSSTSTDDTILDRNVCLVDTPGYQETCRVSQYVESHLQKNRLNGLEDSDVLKTIGGSGGLLVDAVLYTIPSSGLTSTDFQYIRQLESLTNVIPLVAHADVLTSEQITESKERIAKQLTGAGIRLFTFAPPASNRDEPDIYAISSKLGSDLDVMDASLLMGSEYVQPLVPTDLSRLLESIFSVDGATWLRHAAATKLLSWRLRHPRTSIRSTGLTLHPEGHVDRRLLRTQTGSLAPLATSLVPRYAQHEERFCRIQFTDWAADLQRSLANERAIQERTARAQAATWMGEGLRGGLGDETNEAMALMRTRGRRDHHRPFNRRHSTGSSQNWALARHQDPLGLLQLKADFRWQGWNTLEMVGGLGLLGGLAWLLV
ncbi:Septin-7 [Colletotrichum shisoi]|uniref:Septin-7 n=1 Tax=Colletotrichum shisoi TaxID=2078593 RepID=A0A5Q4BXS7_9PEZI|nr:Septin-7 [Colletotrichum shisoi]